VISPKQRPLPDNSQHPKDRDFRAPGGIETHNPSKRVIADPLLRLRGHWDLLPNIQRFDFVIPYPNIPESLIHHGGRTLCKQKQKFRTEDLEPSRCIPSPAFFFLKPIYYPQRLLSKQPQSLFIIQNNLIGFPKSDTEINKLVIPKSI
jgi:hypothetical protein